MRPETGTMIFEDDHRGVFVRGDNANDLAWSISMMLDKIDYESLDMFARMEYSNLERLRRLLSSSIDLPNFPQPDKIQRMKRFCDSHVGTEINETEEE